MSAPEVKLVDASTEDLREWLEHFRAMPAEEVDSRWLDVLRELIDRRVAAGVP
jgi:hypothetical protein